MHDAVHEVRDAVYGFVKLTKREWGIVNCSVYQRLRDIHQLAMGHMVYPGANHTRFEHSLGCLHLSSVILDHLREKQGDLLKSEYAIDSDNFSRVKQILRLGALLHDVGHPPFSHSAEDLLPLKPDGRGRLDHEDMSVRLIRDSEIGRLITAEFGTDGITPEDVISVATKPGFATGNHATAYHIILNAILTGDLGADRVDYLLRDAYHSGQASGQFDYKRLIAAIALVAKPEGEGEGSALGVDQSGWLVAEQMIVARYLMYIALYFHKTKRIYEKHLESFMRAWLAGKGGHLPYDLTDYVALSDSTILAELNKAAVASLPGHDDAVRFQNRGHMRLAKELILADNFTMVKTLSGSRRVPDRERFKNLTLHVRKKFGTRKIIADAPDHSATKMFDKSRILVFLDGQTRYLDDISEIVRGMSSNIWRGRIYTDKAECERVRVACDKWLASHSHNGGKGLSDDNK